MGKSEISESNLLGIWKGNKEETNGKQVLSLVGGIKGHAKNGQMGTQVLLRNTQFMMKFSFITHQKSLLFIASLCCP